MPQSDFDNFLSSFLTIVTPQLTDDYTSFNLIDKHYSKLHEALQSLRHEARWELILELRSRLRGYYELSGKYTDGIRAGETYLQAAQELQNTLEEAWIETKDLSWLFILAHEYKQAIAHLERGLQLFNRLFEDGSENAAIGRFYALRYLGVAHEQILRPANRDFSRAEYYFNEARNILQSIPTEHRESLSARINQNYGNLYFDKGFYKEAESNYRNSLSVFERLDDREHIAGAAIKVGKACLYQAIKIRSSKGAYYSRIQVDQLLGEAERHFLRSWEISAEMGWVEGQARCKEHLSRVFELQNQLNFALQMAKEALMIYRSIRSIRNIESMEERVNNLEAQTNADRTLDAFIIMPMGIDNATLEDYRQTVIEVFDRLSLKAGRVDDITDVSKITDRVSSLIECAEFVVSDLTHERPNVYYETGLAHALKKKVILTAKEGTKIHFDLKDYDILFYDSVTSLKQKIASKVQELRKGSFE